MSERMTDGGRRRQYHHLLLVDLVRRFRACQISFMEMAPSVESIAAGYSSTFGPYWDSEVYERGVEFEVQYATMLDRGRQELTPTERTQVDADLDALLDLMAQEPGDRMSPDETVTLYRPVGPKELALIAESGYTAFPPRLPEQPIFYPVTNEPYAVQIARDWNSKSAQNGNAGFVTRFAVRASFLAGYRVEQVGARQHQEYWIPAEELEQFNANIVGQIEVIAEYRHGERVESGSNPTP